jgi:class 3 adenylate cyclase
MIKELLDDLQGRVDSELTTPVEIEDVDSVPSLEAMYAEKRAWKRIRNVVVVAADLKGSTRLNFDKYAPTSASLYEALISNCVRIVSSFDAAFVDVQGDGLFALFDGERRGTCQAF